MAKYRVEIGYRTKSGGVAVGMTIDAFGPDEAEEIAREKVLKGYPARKWAYSDIREDKPWPAPAPPAMSEEIEARLRIPGASRNAIEACEGEAAPRRFKSTRVKDASLAAFHAKYADGLELAAACVRAVPKLLAEIDRLRAAPPGVVVAVPQWRQDKPETAGWYTAYSAERAKVPEEGVEMPSLYLWDGANWRHYSGWFDHAITHWMDIDLPDPPALNKDPAP